MVDIQTIKPNKEAFYKELKGQLKALIDPNIPKDINLLNICSVIKEQCQFFWVGFYLVKTDILQLGPFQGPSACTTIRYNKGVCGKSWAENTIYRVDNVTQFDGHISCNPLSKSELVIPIVKNEKVIAVLDIDADQYAFFDETDQKHLQHITSLLLEQELL